MKLLYILPLGLFVFSQAQALTGQCQPRKGYEGYDDPTKTFFPSFNSCAANIPNNCDFCSQWSPNTTPPPDPLCNFLCTG